jgi:uncharacterized membrane protein (UPF0127 family)
MAQLMNSKNQILASDLRIADRMWSRMRGLLGTESLQSQEALWIHRCNSIHTFFMKYAIDCVFLDQDLKIKALVAEVKPGRMLFPIWGAQSVVEMKSGQIKNLDLNLGEQLYVRS